MLKDGKSELIITYISCLTAVEPLVVPVTLWQLLHVQPLGDTRIGCR